MALMKLGMKVTKYHHEWRNCANKSKYFGGKNREFNGTKREKETLASSIDLQWRT